MKHTGKAVLLIGYLNAEEILPKELLDEIRQYAQGCALYIPKKRGARETWGAKSGMRAELDVRNRAILKDRGTGLSVEALAERYCLSQDSIRKILRKKQA